MYALQWCPRIYPWSRSMWTRKDILYLQLVTPAVSSTVRVVACIVTLSLHRICLRPGALWKVGQQRCSTSFKLRNGTVGVARKQSSIHSDDRAERLFVTRNSYLWSARLMVADLLALCLVDSLVVTYIEHVCRYRPCRPVLCDKLPKKKNRAGTIPCASMDAYSNLL
jgi:hypothetical protein